VTLATLTSLGATTSTSTISNWPPAALAISASTGVNLRINANIDSSLLKATVYVYFQNGPIPLDSFCTGTMVPSIGSGTPTTAYSCRIYDDDKAQLILVIDYDGTGASTITTSTSMIPTHASY